MEKLMGTSWTLPQNKGVLYICWSLEYIFVIVVVKYMFKGDVAFTLHHHGAKKG